MAEQMMRPQSRRVIKYKDSDAYVELTRQDLYDRKQLAVTGTQTVSFFKNPGSTLLDTNMTVSGMMASPNAFSIYGISAFVQQGTSEEDLVKLINESFLEFRMSSKPYLQAPFHQIPAAGGLHGFASTTKNDKTIFQAQNGMPSVLAYLPLDIEGEPIHLVSQQDFAVQLTTQAAGNFSAQIYVTVHLVGVWYRPIL